MNLFCTVFSPWLILGNTHGGRYIKKTLQISDCGKNGNQLLKLAKNTTAQLYIIQHVNKINPEVIEALKDHLLLNFHLSKIIICPVDGKDTARLLQGMNKDLELLMNKKIGISGTPTVAETRLRMNMAVVASVYCHLYY